MKATATIAAEPGTLGTTRLATLAGQAPLLLRRTGPPGPTATVHLVNGAAGPLGGDRLDYRVEVGAGADLRVESIASSVALPGRQGADSRLGIRVRIEAGGSLHWSPQPLIVAAAARHHTDTRIDLAAGARLVWRDEVVLGRDGEAPGSVATRLRVRHGGRPLLHHDLNLGPDYPGSLGPAMTGGHRTVGTVLIVDPAWDGVDGPDRMPGVPQDWAASDSGSDWIAALPLTGSAVLISAVAENGLLLSRLLDRVLNPVLGRVLDRVLAG